MLEEDEGQYFEHENLISELRMPMKIAFNLESDLERNMNFTSLGMYSDAIFARNFEKLQLHYEFTDD